MFKRILIANRGEIAVRIMRACREMDIETVVVYSEEDKKSLPVMTAAKAVCIGPAKAADSYLNETAIIETALKTHCDAIHPGYGFLSENADFAKKCEENGLVFIGPGAEVIRRMGDKQSARKLMMENHVPVVPGSKELITDMTEANRIAAAIGYPVLVKASAGGGGKGMRRVYQEEDLEHNFEMARAEARAAFGNDAMYLEKLIINPRHVEVQILADRFGRVLSLGERDCSIQKNNQKMLEEAPSPFLSPKLREEMCETAIRAAKAAGYYSAGTVEFVVDEDKNFYFIEMNTRIQVEHPVTEEAVGIDLLKEQIRIAAGMQLRLKQEDIQITEHAIECRINAKSTGTVRFLHLPQGYGVRVETHLFSGYKVSPFYDPMVAKVIVRGKTRLEAIRRMRRALEELIIDGIGTNEEFMHLMTYHPDFILGRYTTAFWDKNHQEIEDWIKEGSIHRGH